MSDVVGPEIPDQAQVALSVPDDDSEDSDSSSTSDDAKGTDTPAPSDDGARDGAGAGGDAPASSSDPEPPKSSDSSGKPASSSTPPSSEEPQTTLEAEVVDLVNDQRADTGCDPLEVDTNLADAAQEHSSDMAAREYFDHTTPEGLNFADRIVNAGYPLPGAENIAHGQPSPSDVMTSWMESDGHRANILNCELKRIGVGLDEDGMYWTQDFGY
jgi:uncharacterized protein YkwD